jgi:hypothetical protein
MGTTGRRASGASVRRALTSLAAGAGLLACVLVAGPANASPGQSNAEKVRGLNLMLMVTSLRCRTTPDDFQAGYASFVRKQLKTINRASAELHSELAIRYGRAGAQAAYDRLSTRLANAYGLGHPWLNCAQLRTLTDELADSPSEASLAVAADELLAPSGDPQIALAGR